MKTFDQELKKIALKRAPDILAKCGEIVETLWGDWKKPHKVKIYEVGIQLVKLDTRARKDNETAEQWIKNVELIGVGLYYYALRLKADGSQKDVIGSGIALSNFIKSNGQKWEKKHDDFNHCGLSWKISSLRQ